MTLVDVRVLGDVSVAVEGREIPIGSARQRSVLALLAMSGEAPLGVDRIVDLLWWGAPPRTARKNVHVLVERIRSSLGIDGALRRVDGGYVLDPAQVSVDLLRFEHHLDRVRTFERRRWWHEAAEHAHAALAQWRGDAFGDLADHEWARLEANRLDDRRIDATESWARATIETGNAQRAVARLDELVARHPHRPRLHELRIRALAGSSRQVQALDACRVALRELPQDANGEVRALQRRVLEQDPRLVRSAAAAATYPQPPRHATALFGRHAELEALSRALLDGARLVSLVGPGGAGKTRLAAEHARRLGDRFDGVAWIDLGSLTDARSVPLIVLQALGIVGGPEDAIQTVARAIGSRRLLLVFDNFEHVLEAAPVVEQIRASTPRAVFLVTTRHRLDVDDERIVELSPFPVPSSGDLESTAVAMFRERARLVDGLVDDSVDDDVIRRICIAVDCLPLGIELAAARTRLLTPSQVLAGIAASFGLLSTSAIDLPDRHRSLSSVVGWSYEMLGRGDQVILQTLSIFAGGACPDDVAALLGIGIDEVERSLDRLVDHSLASEDVDPLGRRRAYLLDTVARAVRERFEPHCERDLVERHAALMLEIAAASDTHVPEAHADRERLVVELANVRAAIDHGLQHDHRRAAEIYAAMRRHYFTRGSLPEAEAIGDLLDLHLDALDPALRARVSLVRGHVLRVRGQVDAAMASLEAAIAIVDVIGPDSERVIAHTLLVDALRAGDAHTDAEIHSELALAIAERDGDPWLRGLAAAAHGMTLGDMERPEPAEIAYQEAQAQFALAGDAFWVATMRTNLAAERFMRTGETSMIDDLREIADWMQGNGFSAFAAYVDSLRIRCDIERGEHAGVLADARERLAAIRECGEGMALTFAASCLSVPALGLQRLGLAEEFALEALNLAATSGVLGFVEYPLVVYAQLRLLDGDVDTASRAVHLVDTDAIIDRYALDRGVARILGGLLDTLGIAPDPETSLDRRAAIAELVRDAYAKSSDSTFARPCE